MSLERKNLDREKNFSLVFVRELVNQWKKDGDKIFYVEGVFDRFHEGHKSFFKYIRRKIEKRRGDKVRLIVAVESDNITKKKKGNNRPYDNENIRLKEVRKQPEVDYAFIKDIEVRHLIDDLKFLGIDYIVIPDEYIYNKLTFKFFQKFILPKLKKNNIKVVFSRHKQYGYYGVDDKYINLHTTDLIDKGLDKFKVKTNHIIYLTKESILTILNI